MIRSLRVIMLRRFCPSNRIAWRWHDRLCSWWHFAS